MPIPTYELLREITELVRRRLSMLLRILRDWATGHHQGEKDAAIKRYVDELDESRYLESWSSYETMC
jgi:hypothetical protein